MRPIQVDAAVAEVSTAKGMDPVVLNMTTIAKKLEKAGEPRYSVYSLPTYALLHRTSLLYCDVHTPI